VVQASHNSPTQNLVRRCTESIEQLLILYHFFIVLIESQFFGCVYANHGRIKVFVCDKLVFNW
jgi:drug/metabolite transporter superfamily protein YnfA